MFRGLFETVTEELDEGEAGEKLRADQTLACMRG